MTQSFTSRAVSLFPPARRLRQAVAGLGTAVGELRSQHDRLRQDLAVLRDRMDVSPPPPQSAAPLPAAPPADASTELDRMTRRELGEAALRHLPFLPGGFAVEPERITVTGYCGAPDGITDHMAFFVNGRRIDDVDYPVEDPELKARFPDIEGMGMVFRARIDTGLEALRAERFWRFDAAPNGYWNEACWRQAVHYMNPAMERFAFPPVANIQRVIGDTSMERFAMGGAMIFNNVAHCLRERGRGWSDFPNILDWGCGAGRLTRYLVSETGSAVTGVDIDPDNIAWCRQAIPGGTFHTVPLRPPTELPDGQFDLVFGLSVLTHLQEHDQFLWLKELQRITKPGALLFLSVQGRAQFAYNRFPPQLYRQLQAQGYIDLCRDAALDAVVTDKDYYRAAMHARPYIRERWGAFFEILAFEDAIAGMQDFVVMRRRPEHPGG